MDKASAQGAAITEAEIKEEASICKARWGISMTRGLNWGAPGVIKGTVPHPEGYEGSQDSACYGSKASGHHRMDFREGHVCKVGTDEQRCLRLKPKRNRHIPRATHPISKCSSQAWSGPIRCTPFQPEDQSCALRLQNGPTISLLPVFSLFLEHVIRHRYSFILFTMFKCMQLLGELWHTVHLLTTH